MRVHKQYICTPAVSQLVKSVESVEFARILLLFLTSSISCFAGSYCPLGSSESAGSVCPATFYCEGGTADKAACHPVLLNFTEVLVLWERIFYRGIEAWIQSSGLQFRNAFMARLKMRSHVSYQE